MATAIPKGSTVLVTGVNGYIASHLADQLLSAGFNVRGTVRNASRTQWIRDLFDEKYGPGRFETVVVPKVDAEGAWDEAVKGRSTRYPARLSLPMLSTVDVIPILNAQLLFTRIHRCLWDRARRYQRLPLLQSPRGNP